MSRLLPHLRRRLYSSSSSSNKSSTPLPPQDAKTAAALFLAAHASSPPQVRTQTLDHNQLHLLSSTLSRPAPPLPLFPNSTPPGHHNTTTTSSSSSAAGAGAGAAVPPCHHLVYFTPSQASPLLGPDGTDTTYNPPAPFTRRMWAGGEVVWPRTGGSGGGGGAKEEVNLLRVGQTVRETTRVRSAKAKRTRGGEEMVVVGVEKVFENEDGVAVVDKRNWIFLPALIDPLFPSQTSIEPPSSEALPYLLHSQSHSSNTTATTHNNHKSRHKPTSSPTPLTTSSSSPQLSPFPLPPSAEPPSSPSHSTSNTYSEPLPYLTHSPFTSSPSTTPLSSPFSTTTTLPPTTPLTTPVPFPPGHRTLDIITSATTLFRFSALTFNAHKIHYDSEWCRRVEGHRGIVVHGPLNLILVVDFWRDVLSGGGGAGGVGGVGVKHPGYEVRGGSGKGGRDGLDLVPARVVYRATGPFYAGEPYRIVLDEERDGVTAVRIVDGYGNVGMVGQIERFRG